MTTLVPAPRKPPRRQLRRWISLLYHVRHTVHAWRTATNTFFQQENLRGYLYDSDGEMERKVRTRIKRQIVEFFREGVKKIFRRWLKCVENGSDHSYYYYYYYWYSALGPVWAETRAQSVDWYGSGTLHPGQVLRGSLPLLSPAFFLDVPTFHHQVPPRPPRRERSQWRKVGTVGENVVR